MFKSCDWYLRNSNCHYMWMGILILKYQKAQSSLDSYFTFQRVLFIIAFLVDLSQLLHLFDFWINQIWPWGHINHHTHNCVIFTHQRWHTNIPIWIQIENIKVWWLSKFREWSWWSHFLLTLTMFISAFFALKIHQKIPLVALTLFYNFGIHIYLEFILDLSLEIGKTARCHFLENDH